MSKHITLEDFVCRAQEVHGNLYNYTESVYKGQHQDLTIICEKHGSFQQRPINHVRGKQGCPLCGSGKKRTTKDLITLAKEAHGSRYDYSQVKYKNATTKVQIVCKQHGMFEQTPDMHCFSATQGCPHCKASLGERKIYKTLMEMGIINFVCEKTFEGCVAPDTNLSLRFDFYLPDHNLLIEYDGQAHFEKVNYSGNLTKKEMTQRLKRTQKLDKIKTKWAKDTGIKLLRIPYWEYEKIESLIKLSSY